MNRPKKIALISTRPQETNVQLSDELKNSEINLIYYAGHGISAKGKNYLIPTGLNPVVDDPDEDPYRNVKRNAISCKNLNMTSSWSIYVLY